MARVVLQSWQEVLEEVEEIYEKSYYDMVFSIVRTRTEYYITFRVYAESLRLAEPEDIDYIIEMLASAYSVITYPLKLVIDCDYLNLSKQIAYWEKQKAKANSEMILPFIDEKIEQFKLLQRASLTEKYWYKVFGETENEVLRNAYMFLNAFSTVIVPVAENTKETKRILKQEHNPLARKELPTDD